VKTRLLFYHFCT